MSSTELTADGHIVLVACVKSKGTRPAAAKDLYTSALFRKERAYAERAGVPWFILSAEHGLVAPDEWLAPYERYLADTTASYRLAWGGWVAARLDLLAGPLSDKVVEIHAGSTYLDVIRPEPGEGLVRESLTHCMAYHGAATRLVRRRSIRNSRGTQ